MLGAAAITFGFSFFGFFFSRLPRCSPLAIIRSSGSERAKGNTNTSREFVHLVVLRAFVSGRMR